ncbi:hypothetical protein POX_d06066 [Penicillium oxalicum]|uniref:hypothetical protein n=1 Tax=Penicillium oxalicum TaxID=69781 RepID=UPI0020B7F1B1|nr:hypothetical protein POX_d06066 [Penicillium oxalicum]KAI2790547.1 hypothetical protein POX_d06066 [Penicillium oxalicum]
MSYDRVLPNPVSFRHETAPLPSLPRPSDLIDHKIMSAPPATSYMALPHRPSPGMAGNIHATSPQGVRYTSTMHQPNNISQTHQHLVSYDRRHSLAKIDRDGGQSPVQRTVKPSPTITTRDLGTTRSVSPSGSSSPAKSVKSDGLQFCLCQPEPKIPRPRNAHNPGMANPEISKVIGEQWRSLSEGEKSKWKALAEEEKIRHAQQYPAYRYQPRRLGRDGSARNLASGISHNPTGGSTCNRCGGRIMNAPASPMTPFTPIGGSGSRDSLSTQPSAPYVKTTTAVMTASSSQCHGKADRPPKLIRIDLLDRPKNRKMDDAQIMSPDVKRRRVSHSTGLKPPSASQRDLSPESPFPGTPYATGTSAHPSRRMASLIQSPPFQNMPEPAQPPLPPPPPSVTTQGHLQVQTQPVLDPSLKLPPLKTALPSTPMTPYPTGDSSVEKAVMTIPFLNKIKLLAKISPPLVPSFRESPSRGPVIAVDGQDADLVRSATEYLQRLLEKEDKFCARIFHGPDLPAPRTAENGGGPMGDATVDYLNTISAWHRISDEVVGFVRSNSQTVGGTESDTLHNPRVYSEKSPKTQIVSIIQHDRHSPDPSPSPRTIIPRTASLQIDSPESSAADSQSPSTSPSTTASVLANDRRESNQNQVPIHTQTVVPGLTPSLTPTPTPTPSSSVSSLSSSRLPVALVPRYQLTTADTFACSVPINDSYAPLDHWQWMASLWRACVGPDITVYVRECSREELERAGAVEIRLADAGTVTLRKVAGAPGLEEKALKRMGFEIEDFLTQ